MRRTALLVSAALLTSLLPMTVARAAADDPPPTPVDRFEGEVPFADPPAGGLFTWGSDNDDRPALRFTARPDAPEGDKVRGRLRGKDPRSERRVPSRRSLSGGFG